MRVVWKDSNARYNYKPIKYRGHHVTGYHGKGWVIDIEGDNNIYKSHYCAQNAIDKALGERERKVSDKRKRAGIQIVGRKDMTA